MAERTIVVFERLPDRSGMTPQERMIVLRADTIDTANKARAKLVARAHRFALTNWVGDPDTISVSLGESGETVVASYTLTRPD